MVKDKETTVVSQIAADNLKDILGNAIEAGLFPIPEGINSFTYRKECYDKAEELCVLLEKSLSRERGDTRPNTIMDLLIWFREGLEDQLTSSSTVNAGPAKSFELIDEHGNRLIPVTRDNEPKLVAVKNLHDGEYDGGMLGCQTYANCTILIQDGAAYAIIPTTQEGAQNA